MVTFPLVSMLVLCDDIVESVGRGVLEETEAVTLDTEVCEFILLRDVCIKSVKNQRSRVCELTGKVTG